MTVRDCMFDVVVRATILAISMLLQNAQLDFFSFSSLSSRAMSSNGHVDVDLPRATWHRAGGFLAEFGVWLRDIGFGTWTVNKGAGNHLTDWWLHARMDSNCPAKSQVLAFHTCYFCVCFRWNVLTPYTHPRPQNNTVSATTRAQNLNDSERIAKDVSKPPDISMMRCSDHRTSMVLRELEPGLPKHL